MLVFFSRLLNCGLTLKRPVLNVLSQILKVSENPFFWVSLTCFRHYRSEHRRIGMIHFLVFLYIAPAYLYSSGSVPIETQSTGMMDIWKGRTSLRGVSVSGPYLRVEGKIQPNLLRVEGLVEILNSFLLSDNRELRSYISMELGHRGLSGSDLKLFLTTIQEDQGRGPGSAACFRMPISPPTAETTGIRSCRIWRRPG